MPLGCDFFQCVGEKRIDIRRFLGYVCQIAKVRVLINFGWVSLFTQKYVKCDFFAHIDIKSYYQFYTFFSLCVYMCVYIDTQISRSICVHIDIKHIHV